MLNYEFTNSGRRIVCRALARVRVLTGEQAIPRGARSWHVSVNGGPIVDTGIGADRVDPNDPANRSRFETAVLRFIAIETWKNQG